MQTFQKVVTILKILLNSDVFIKRQTHDKNKVYKQKKTKCCYLELGAHTSNKT